jgi:carbamoyltransferase
MKEDCARPPLPKVLTRETDVNIIGFSGIANGDYYRENFGLRFVGHDSSVALVTDGKLVFAVEEERLSREKHTSRFPVHAVDAALRHAGLELRDIERMAYTWHASPARIAHMFTHHAFRVPLPYWTELALAGSRVICDLMWPRRLARQFGTALRASLPQCDGVSHHLGHSACAYFTSPFDHAAVLTVDGQGEDESGSLGEWRGTEYRHFRSVYSPDSIGILYGMVTDFLGMRAAWDEYKVMGMAAYGDAERFAPAFRKLIALRPGGRYRTHRTAMVFKPGYCDQMLARIFGLPQRGPDEPLQQVHFDIAASLQEATEEVLFHLLRHLRQQTSAPNLCLAGGVFLNSVSNGKIRQSGLFENVHIPPVPGDHGGALGAALLVYHRRSGAPRGDIGFTPFCGPGYSEADIERALKAKWPVVDYRRPEHLAEYTAELLASDKIIGWFQGRSEYGPRALGHRSILANPSKTEMKDTVNARIKHREPFRPFAGAAPLESARDFFEIDGASPYMQFVLPVHEAVQPRIPAVVHHGTCRVQTVAKDDDPHFHDLLQFFGSRTGVPVLLNTSFNDADEPIVCSPEDALATFLKTDLDALVLGPFVVTKR